MITITPPDSGGFQMNFMDGIITIPSIPICIFTQVCHFDGALEWDGVHPTTVLTWATIPIIPTAITILSIHHIILPIAVLGIMTTITPGMDIMADITVDTMVDTMEVTMVDTIIITITQPTGHRNIQPVEGMVNFTTAASPTGRLTDIPLELPAVPRIGKQVQMGMIQGTGPGQGIQELQQPA